MQSRTGMSRRRRSLFNSGQGGAAYYVDATGGDDGASGYSPADAWQTLGKVRGETFQPGDQVLFKRGETWRGELQVSGGGSAGVPVIYGAYGSGAKPVISGAQLVETWSSTVGEEYSAACAFTPGHVYDDNEQLTLGAGAGALARGEYFWAANVLHVRLSDGGDPNGSVMEGSYSTYNIEVLYSHLTFRDLTCDKCKACGVFAKQADPRLTNITFENVTSIRAANEGFRICGGGAPQPGPNNVTLHNCTVQLWDRDDSTIYPAIYQREGDGTGGDNFVVRNCLVDGWVPWGADTNDQRNGIQADGGDGITIHDNEVTGCDHGIVMGNTAENWDIARNWIHEIGDDGLFFFNVDSADGKAYNNVLYRCSNQFIDCQTGSGNFGLFANNSCYESLDQAISLLGDDGMTATFYNNIFVITQNPSQRFVIVNDVFSTVDIDDFVFDYNLYYDVVSPPVPNPFAYANNPANNQTWGQWQAAGRDVHGVTADPDYVNAGGTDAEDYKVNAGSPAIDEGTTIASITDDYEGVIRPQGDGYDIGAFESEE